MEESHYQTLHIVMLPWLALGHMLPYFFLSISLAQKSHRISFITTLKNASKLPPIPPHLSHLITLIHLPLPETLTLNLPPDSNSTSDLPSHNLRPFLSKSFDSFQKTLSNLIQSNQIPSPDFIFFDYAAHWVPSICANLRIPCALFSIFKPAFLSFIGPPCAEIRNPDQLAKSPQWIPLTSSIAHTSLEANAFFQSAFTQNESGASEIDRLQKSVKGCQFVLIRSCNEFEREWLELLRELYEKPVIPVGLLLPPRSPSDERGRHAALDWLDRQEQGSTVYVAFGSEVKLSGEQVREIQLGLEWSELPFVWALRASSMPIETDRGLVCIDWVPQLEILAHDSIGGFLTHAGWSSIIEGLGVGRPMVMMPMMADQPLNARHLVEKGIGVEVLRDENGLFLGDGIAKGLRMVMVEDEGERFRAKAKEFEEVFANEELNEFYVRELVEQLEHFVHVGSSV